LHLAGQQAAKRAAYAEAISQLEKGLELLETLPGTPERNRQELLIQVALGQVLTPIKGYTAPEVEQAYVRAQVLCHDEEETYEFLQALVGLWVFYTARAELRRARELAEQTPRLAERWGDSAFVQVAQEMLGLLIPA
jgi:predicted ATPase